MKALVYTNPHELHWGEEPEPRPQPGEALIRIEAAGICGSDMHAFHGDDSRRIPPLVLGHEAAGTAESGRLAGRRVVINPLITCGHCIACLDGRTNLCRTRELIGMNRPGAFAELIAIPERNLVPLPAGMEPARAVLSEPAAAALHAVRLAGCAAARPLSEARVLVLGAGAIGLLAALFLSSAGAHAVLLGDTNALRRRTAQACGVLEVYDPLATPPEASSFDVVIEAVGSAATRAAAVAAAKPGSVIVHIGLQEDSGGLDVRTLTLAEITFIGTYAYTVVDFHAALAALQRGLPGGFDWVEQRPLREGQGAFEDLDAGRTAAAKIVLLPMPV